MDTAYMPYCYTIYHKPSNRLYVGSRYTPKSKKANPSELWKSNGYFTSSGRIKKLIELDGIDSFEVVDIITQDEIMIPFGWSSILDYETSVLESVDAKHNPLYINSHNNEFGLLQESRFWEHLTKEERIINGLKSAETCRARKVNSFFDPIEHAISAGKGGKVQGKINAESGHCKAISIQYWDDVHNGIKHVNPKHYYNNGIISILVKEGKQIPEGFILGRMSFQWYNNMVNCIQIKTNDTVPEGYVVGYLKKDQRKNEAS